MQETSTINIDKYSIAIDGIRAIAVLSVVINHFTAYYLPSGYLGVDAFFVISGFVITNSIDKRHDNNLKAFIGNFYKRRIKRLIPALLFSFSLTAFLISFFSRYPKHYILTGLSSLPGFANIYLYLDAVDYWGKSAHYNPFTHTWSLGVEEQFYLLFPLSIWLIAKKNWSVLSLKKTSYFLVLICSVSLISYVIFQKDNPMMTYFLMPFRLWEIGLGCLLFIQLKLTKGNFLKSIIDKVPFIVVLLCMIAIFFSPIEYQIINSVLMVLVTGMLLIKVKLVEYQSNSALITLLTNNLTVYIGKISYSLYLWHWIIITISRWTIGISIKTLPIQIFLMFFLSVFSYHVIEKPLRFTSWRANLGPKLILLPMFLIVLFFSFTLKYWSSNHLFLGNKPTFSIVIRDLPQLENINTKCLKIRTIGNSHSVHIVPMLKAITEKLDIELTNQNHHDYIVIPSGGKSEMNKFNAVLNSLNKNDILILSSRNRYIYQIPYLNGIGDKWIDHSQQKKDNGYGLDKWLRELDEVINKAESRGINVVLFLPNIEFDTKVLNADYSTPQWFRNSTSTNTVSMEFLTSRFPKEFYDEVENRVIQNTNFYTFNPMPLYCSDSDKCSNVKNGVILFNDTNHLTKEGAMMMLNDFCDFLIENKLL